MIKQIVKYEESKDAIVTIAIGEPYLSEWEKYAKKSWILYCKKNKINLFVIIEDLISIDDSKWKKATWQKLLIGDALQVNNYNIINVCYMDTDIIISPQARNIFNFYNNNKYGLISKIENLPFCLNNILKKVAFLRNLYYDPTYPLDSSLFMTPRQIYNFSKLPPMENYACAGVILFNVEKHSDQMKNWFFKYDRNTISITEGDQTHVNWEIQNTNNVCWLAYEFQALWLYEMAEKYPYLYNMKKIKKNQIVDAIRACLMNVDFLHFAGSWHESDMWLHKQIVSDSFVKLSENFETYKKIPVYGKPKGKIVPQKKM